MTTEAPNNQTSEPAGVLEGKYLSFALEHEEYGLQIHQVREIIGLMEITPLPQAPVYVKGVINLRGKIIPVVDIRAKFGMRQVDYTAETCIIVLFVRNILIGIIVDKVCEVLEISSKDIEPAPVFNDALISNFILGMGKVSDRVCILLDIEKILTVDLVVALKP